MTFAQEQFGVLQEVVQKLLKTIFLVLDCLVSLFIKHMQITIWNLWSTDRIKQ